VTSAAADGCKPCPSVVAINIKSFQPFLMKTFTALIYGNILEQERLHVLVNILAMAAWSDGAATSLQLLYRL
jgi:hypothetical protein